MISLATAFLLNHFDASMGWWWVFGIVIALELATTVAQVHSKYSN